MATKKAKATIELTGNPGPMQEFPWQVQVLFADIWTAVAGVEDAQIAWRLIVPTLVLQHGAENVRVYNCLLKSATLAQKWTQETRRGYEAQGGF